MLCQAGRCSKRPCFMFFGEAACFGEAFHARLLHYYRRLVHSDLSNYELRQTMPNFARNQPYRFKTAMYWLQDMAKKAEQQQAQFSCVFWTLAFISCGRAAAGARTSQFYPSFGTSNLTFRQIFQVMVWKSQFLPQFLDTGAHFREC